MSKQPSGSSGNVIGLRNCVAPGAVSENTVKILEDALAKAMAGEIVGVGVAAVYANNHIASAHAYPDGYRWTLMASIKLLDADFMHDLVSDDGKR